MSTCADSEAYSNAVGVSWADSAVEFGLMCPVTTRPCHSRCVAFRPYDEARAECRHAGDGVDIELRRDHDVVGRCKLLEVKIGS